MLFKALWKPTSQILSEIFLKPLSPSCQTVTDWLCAKYMLESMVEDLHANDKDGSGDISQKEFKKIIRHARMVLLVNACNLGSFYRLQLCFEHV